MTQAFVELDWRGSRVRIEHQWLSPERRGQPLMVFLHEGLGSVSMWRDFPQRLCDALGWRGLVYARPGYGQSTQRAGNHSWGPDFLHQQAHELLPALLAALQVPVQAEPPWLFGHSDGGSIALLHAARWPQQVAGLVLLAPHILVEELSITSIAQAREAYRQGELRQRLARHHADVDGAFWGWNNIWLHPDFRAWNITHQLSTITCPLLAVQGLDDEYGTLAQIEGIAAQVPQTRLLTLPACGHSPHRDQPQALIAAVQQLVQPAV